MIEPIFLTISGFMSAWICHQLSIPFANYSTVSQQTRGRVETFIWNSLYYTTIILIVINLITGIIGLTLIWTRLIRMFV